MHDHVNLCLLCATVLVLYFPWYQRHSLAYTPYLPGPFLLVEYFPFNMWLHFVIILCLIDMALARKDASLHLLRQKVAEADSDALRFLRGPNTELALWLRFCNGNIDEAARRSLEKAAWRKKIGKVSMGDISRGFSTDGYALCLGGLKARNGAPIVYSHGLPRGNEAQLRRQTVYMQERVLDACDNSRSLKGRGICAPLTIIDCKQPSFRSPDKALRRGGIDVVARYYPWSNKGTSLFLGVPLALKGIFKLARPFFPKDMYNRFQLVESREDIVREGHVDCKQLPKYLGGTSSWSLQTYVPRRCLSERALCKPPPRGGL